MDGSDDEGRAGGDSLDGHQSPPAASAPPSTSAPPPRPESPAQHRKSPHKESSHRKEESKKNHLEPSTSNQQTKPSLDQRHHGENNHSSPDQHTQLYETSASEPDDNGKAVLMNFYIWPVYNRHPGILFYCYLI